MRFETVDALLGTDELITPAELAECAGIHKRTLMKKLTRRELPSFRMTPRKIVIATRELTPHHIEDLKQHAAYLTVTRAAQFVYFIEAASGPIKIGIAIDPAERLAGLQISHFEELRLIAAVPGGIALETALHRKFAHLRIRGEWFKPEADLLAEIERLNTPTMEQSNEG